MTLNSVSTRTPKADECQQLPVVAQIRPDEAVDRRQRAGGFLGGEDDEVLVIIIVVELQLVVLVVVVVIVGWRAGRLAAGDRASGGSLELRASSRAQDRPPARDSDHPEKEALAP